MPTALSIILFAGMAAQVALGPAARTERSESIRTSLRVVGPLEPGTKSRDIELYRVTMAFENQSHEPATLFVPHVAARAFLMHGAQFKGRQGAVHHYAVGITDTNGEPVADAHFAVFVGGVEAGPEGLPKTLDYSETLDLIRLAGQDKLERLIGYVMVPKGTPRDFTVSATLKTDLAEETDTEAQRLIKLAGPERREFFARATPTLPDMVSAQSGRKLAALREVLSIEPADSIYGAYRIVFTTDSALPPPSGASFGQAFYLDDQGIHVADLLKEDLLHFGYFRERPADVATLRTGDGFSLPRGGAAQSTLPVPVANLLARKRPGPGEYEPSYMQRSENPIDLLAEWNRATQVVLGRHVRWKSDIRDKNLWLMHFRDLTQLHGSRKLNEEEVILRARSLPRRLELGMRYVLFVSEPDNENAGDVTRHQLVRVWWAEDDPLLEFARAFPRLPDLTKADEAATRSARDFFVEHLRSPTPEVRHTAARQLIQLHGRPGGRLTREQRDKIETRIAKEPSEATRFALHELTRLGD